MSDITRIEESEIADYRKLSEGIGGKAEVALMDYNAGLNLIVTNGFSPQDTSSFHEVLTALRSSVKSVSDSMKEVDCMIDCLLEIIDKEILQKEDAMAASEQAGG